MSNKIHHYAFNHTGSSLLSLVSSEHRAGGSLAVYPACPATGSTAHTRRVPAMISIVTHAFSAAVSG